MTTCFRSPTGQCQKTAPCQRTCGQNWAALPAPAPVYSVPADEERIRQIVRDELERAGLVARPVID